MAVEGGTISSEDSPSGSTCGRDQGNPTVARIAVVEDDLEVQKMLIESLTEAGFDAVGCSTGARAVEEVAAHVPDIVLLDLLLPDVHGLDVCRRLRQDPRARGVAVVMLSALVTEDDVARGFEAGADDYVAKPCRMRMLILRLRAVLNRTRVHPTDSPLAHGPLSLLPRLREATLDGALLHLSPSEFRILNLLASNPGRVLSRAELHGAHQEDQGSAERTVDTRIFNLRKKLGAHASLIMTVHGAGYRILLPPQA